MGVLGLAVFGWMSAAIVAALWKWRRAMAASPFNVNWLSLGLYVVSTVALLPVGTPIDASPGNLYFWFFLGMLAKMHDQQVSGMYARAPETVNSGYPAPTFPGYR
jgi:hypothetical protein